MKTLKIFTLLACMILCGLTANSQIMVEEGSFKKIDGFVMTDKNDHTDMNDAPMALIKITTKNISAEQRTKFSFKGNAITYFDVQFKPGEIYLYLSAQAATFIEIIHEDYGKTEFRLPYDLCDFCAYDMVVVYTPQKEEAELIVSGNMDNSLIYVDGRLLGIKEVSKNSEVGATHTWKIECEGYQTESGTVTLNGKTEIYRVLKPVIKENTSNTMKPNPRMSNSIRNWSTIRLSYSSMNLKNVDDDFYYELFDSYTGLDKFNGFSGEFLFATNITKTLPLYIQFGAGFLTANSKSEWQKHYYEYSDEYYYYEYVEINKYKFRFASVYIPINIVYRISLSENLSIMPYLGIKARLNFSGKLVKLYYSNAYYMDVTEVEDEVSDPKKTKFNLFGANQLADEFGGDPFNAGRFQLGWQVGGDFQFYRFIVGFSYGSDLMKIIDGGRFNTIQFSLGITF